MTERLIGETGSRKRRRFLLLPVLVIAFISLFVITAAQAVHDEKFQLDGDVLASTATAVGGTPQAFDWDSFFNSSGATIGGSLTGGFNAAAFERDFRTNPGCSLTAAGALFCTKDQTTYATGSKDTLPITPGWQCNQDNNVNNKIDIMNAYAVKYTDPVSGEKFMYFAMEKYADNGNNNVAFWFLQSGANCVSTGGSTAWTGGHQDGDILIVSAFTNGGGVSGIDAYRWNWRRRHRLTWDNLDCQRQRLQDDHRAGHDLCDHQLGGT